MFNSNLLKAEMIMKGESYNSLSKTLDINKSTLSKKMNGKSEWTLSEIQKMSKLFGIEKTAQIFLH